MSWPFKLLSDTERDLNEATKTTIAVEQQQHSQILPILTREIVEINEESDRRRVSGKLRALDQTSLEACLQTSIVPIIGHKEDDDDEDKKCHLVHKIRHILQRHPERENFNETEYEKSAATATELKLSEVTTATTTTTAKILARCVESHELESKKFFRIGRNMKNGRRKSAFFYNKKKNKQKQTSVDYQDHYKKTNFTTLTMIMKSIILLFLMLSTNFYLSLGSSANDDVSTKNNNYITQQQLVKSTKLAAQETQSSNNNISNSSNHNSLVSNTKSTNLLKSKANSSTFIVSSNNVLLLPEAELIKRQAEDDINQPILGTTPTSESQAEARNGDFPDDSNNNSNNNNSNEDNNSSDSDNLTQIPPEQTAATRTTTTSTTTTTALPALTTTKKTPFSSWSSAFSGSTKRSVPTTTLRVTENELLPFSDFNVQQPAFSDLMKSWPPTTQQSNSPSYHSSSHSTSAYSRVSNAHLQASRARHSNQPNYNARWQHNGANNRHSIMSNQDESELMRQMRNHLNEDLDDTIITADQSFEQDQLPEPPTWINYLGELGDYIYLQLRQYLESFSHSNSNVGGRNKGSVTSDQTNNDQDNNDSNSSYQQREQQQQKEREQAQRKLKIETIDELLDDYYYDQYENSQVLYYGSQLVREGDIFEIGCYLPSDQSAEWTKSGRLLVGSKASSAAAGGVSSLSSPRVIRRSDFLGAKQNYSLKVFEASLVS